MKHDIKYLITTLFKAFQLNTWVSTEPLRTQKVFFPLYAQETYVLFLKRKNCFMLCF